MIKPQGKKTQGFFIARSVHPKKKMNASLLGSATPARTVQKEGCFLRLTADWKLNTADWKYILAVFLPRLLKITS